MPGFTKLDNDLLRVILTSDFTKRQLKILLLIIRFSYGYQKRYAVLKKRDFSAAGVSPFCIKEELEKLSKLKVICHEGAHDVFWINEEISQWDVETFGDNLRRMARISVKNSLKRQMSIYQNAIVDVAKTTTANNKERERYSNNDSPFIELLRDYLTNVTPLSEGEVTTLRQVAAGFPPQAISKAISEISRNSDRSFTHFLNILDTYTAQFRRGRPPSLRSSLRKLWKIFPRP